MSEKKWTPGPWADIQGYVTCRGGYNVATVSLIDAMQHPETDFLCDEIGIARSALAKARGE